jgi:ATP-dependent DNA ligase
MSVFKPQLLPNNEAGTTMEWDTLLTNVPDWLFSEKLDGARVEIPHSGPVLGRSLKPIPNVFIQEMADQIRSVITIPTDFVLEAEFFAYGMTFSEIMHFFKTEDIQSDKTIKKYLKDTSGYPGRDSDWLTTWHPELKFYAFDLVNTKNPNESKWQRVLNLRGICDAYGKCVENGILKFIPQWTFDDIDQVYQAYDQSILHGNEGLVCIKKTATYKYGRHTLKSNLAYKIKEDNLEFDGKILDVVEGTMAKEGTEKTINELGRSVTSKLQEDREPSGLAKGFEVLMEDGNTLIVSLKDFDHSDRRYLLSSEGKAQYVGKWIKFTGMAPVKAGGCPRHAHFTKGNIRDDK